MLLVPHVFETTKSNLVFQFATKEYKYHYREIEPIEIVTGGYHG